MTPGPVHGRIHVSANPDAGLRPGATVVLHVIKSLDSTADPAGAFPRRWAVGIGGRVYPAATEVPLEPGATLRARVGMIQGKLVLSISDVLPDEVPDAVRAALQSQGIPAGGDAETIARALSRSGLPLLAETILKVRALLTRTGIDARTGARAAATLVDRGFDPGGETARALLPVLAFGQKGGEDHRRYRGRDLPGSRAAVKELVSTLAADPAGGASLLQAYNHTRGSSQTWVVIPFVFSAMGEGLKSAAAKGSPRGTAAKDNPRGTAAKDNPRGTAETVRIAGTIKILYDAFKSRPVALSLVTDDISFHLPLLGKHRSLSVFCSGALRQVAARALDSLRAKFHNMGLEVDDTINEGDAFDGFSPVEEGVVLSSVDTVG